MRVLHIIPNLGGGGAERQVAYLAEEMCRRKVDVHIATSRGGPHLSRIVDAGATVHSLTGSGNHDPRLVSRTIGLVRALRPDIVQTWLSQSDVLGGIAALTQRIPWVLCERTAPPFYRRSLKNTLRHSVGRFADAIVANSAFGLSYWNAARAKKFVVPNAVDVRAIDAAMPAAIGSADSEPVVMYVGRLESVKNVETLVPALCNVAHAKNAIVLVCGEGSREAEMRAQIEKHGCSDRFRMLGFTDTVWQLMKRADVFVSVSWLEGHPNAVIEAAVAGCPLVVSDIPSHRAFLDDRSATFAPPSDAAAIARAVSGVLDDAAAAREKTRHARAAVEGWSIEHVTGEYLKIYEGLMF